ncbi:hypothetical protein J4E89_000451 [Alternaria sp. Ai002NY15]|nr:hypothetical protein J4E89_000451 [Alternaria sp. Ai002NY15]
MSFKREREETPDLLSRQDSLSPDNKRVKVEVYQLDFGEHKGRTLEDLSDEELARIADDDALVNSKPGLREALIHWANNIYKIDSEFGGYYNGCKLGEAPISWINSWIYATGGHKHTYTRIALKYHFLDREPEMPGSKWVFTYGKHVGKSFDEIDDDYLPVPYDQWTKDQGIGTKQNPKDFDPRNPYREDGTRIFHNRGKDDVADALVYNERMKLRKLLRDHPNAPNYRMPWYQNYCRGQHIRDVDLDEVLRIHIKLDNKRVWGDEYDKDLWAAVKWRVIKHHLVRWNWRGHCERVNGRCVWIPEDLGPYLYPSTEIEVSDEPYIPRF